MNAPFSTLHSPLVISLTAALFVTYLVVATGFVNRKRQHIYCHTIEVTVCDSAVNRFVNRAEALQLIGSGRTTIIGTAIDDIDTRRMEEQLNGHSVVKSAEVFTSIDGTLHVRIHQRRPVVRVLTEKGSFYIDQTGYLFPFSPVYTAYVPVVTGNVPCSFKASYRGSIPKQDSLFQKIYAVSLFLQRHEFWQSQVLQLHVINPNNVELIPRVGAQIVKLGSLDNIEYKLKKLHAFYLKAMPAEGWNKYGTLDLRYSNQVVATLKVKS